MEGGNCLLLTIGRNLSLICSYRPPSLHPSLFINSLDKLLSTISNNEIILTGDINLDILPSNTTGYACDYLNMMYFHGLRQGVNKPTRIKSCIDHFMIRTKKRCKTVVFDPLTDHAPILLEISTSKDKNNNETLYKTIYDHKLLPDLIDNINWYEFYKIQDPNAAVTFFIDKIECALNNCKIVKKVPNRKRPLKPWITFGLIKCLRKRDRLHKRTKRNPTDLALLDEYKKYRNTCNNIIKNVKKSYYKDKLDKNYGNPKGMWKIIKEACSLSNNRAPSNELLNLKYDTIDALNVVNNYFISIGGTLAKSTLNSLKKTEKELTLDLKNDECPKNSLLLSPTDPQEICGLLSKLNSCSASGYDNIPTRIFKEFRDLLSPHISYICNLSIKTGVFPKPLKKAIVIPIHKSGDRSCPSNYRPISLLCTLAKVLEKCVKARDLLAS
ncbi:unnamed protein product [Colias eurytheme]|nr:unnamed protein product [Colias eurytheme]